MQDLGERIASLSASFEAEKDYNHDRWHKLANDLTPLVNLPERLTRETGRLHGVIDGKMSNISRELERSIEAAIKRSIEPLSERVKTLELDVEGLKLEQSRMSGAKLLGAWLISTLLSAIAAFGMGTAVHK